jgi:hypothetical protein
LSLGTVERRIAGLFAAARGPDNGAAACKGGPARCRKPTLVRCVGALPLRRRDVCRARRAALGRALSLRELPSRHELGGCDLCRIHRGRCRVDRRAPRGVSLVAGCGPQVLPDLRLARQLRGRALAGRDPSFRAELRPTRDVSAVMSRPRGRAIALAARGGPTAPLRQDAPRRRADRLTSARGAPSGYVDGSCSSERSAFAKSWSG